MVETVSNASIASTDFIAELLAENDLVNVILEGLSHVEHSFSSKCLYALGHISASPDLALVGRIINEGDAFKRLEAFLNRQEIHIVSKTLWAISNLLISSD